MAEEEKREVDKLPQHSRWPDDKPFPFTAEDCLWILKGWMVRPAGMTPQEVLDLVWTLPGRLEILEPGYISLKL
jgi:hypothetical protein